MNRVALPALVSLLLVSGCSGFLPNLGSGPVVPPSTVAQFHGDGSLSTLWYLGSDRKYHYFAHYVKTSTRYRVRRDELRIPDEFPHKSKDAVFIGNAPFWRELS